MSGWWSGLAPQRRRVLSVLAAAAVVLVVLFGVVAVRSGSSPAPGPAAQQDQPGTVLLVPGYGGGLDSLKPLQARLVAEGRDARLVEIPGEALGPIADQVAVLEQAVAQAEAGGAPSVDIVGYSNGGVVTRDWVATRGQDRVRRVVTLGSPHHGTQLAGFAAALGGGSLCSGACADVRPGSDLLKRLNDGDETPPGPTWTAVYTQQDQTVTPPTSARLAGAVNVDLQSVCADAVISHGGLPADPLTIGVVVQALSGGLSAAPGRGDCAALRALGTG